MTKRSFIFPTLIIIVLIITRYYQGLLLFHTLAELLSILAGILMMVVVANTRGFIKNDFLLYLGIMYSAVSIVDLLHAFTVNGMPFFDISDGEITVKLWMYARLSEALILLFAPYLLTKKLNQPLAISIAAVIVIISCIGGFALQRPILLDESGLTMTKIVGEYFIIALLMCAAALFYKRRKLIAPSIYTLIMLSISLKLISEFCFTLYTNFAGIPFVLGHIAKFLSFWVIYLAIVKTVLKEPMSFLAQSSNSYDALPISAIRVDNLGVIHQINREVLCEFSLTKDQMMYKKVHHLFHPLELTEGRCRYCDAIRDHQSISNEEVYLPQYERWFLISLAGVDTTSRRAGMVQSLTNITQQKQQELELQSHKYALEKMVDARTQELQKSFDTLVTTQEQLIESKKMAALGGLVAGVSHEINTPIGVSFTAASHLAHSTSQLANLIEKNKMTRTAFNNYVQEAKESCDLMVGNLRRAADLIGSFKQVAVDQSSEEWRRFNIKEYIHEILISLQPTIRHRPIIIEFSQDNDFEVAGSPSAISQIVSNLLINAFIHAYSDDDKGTINIEVSSNSGQVTLVFKDDGRGMSKENLAKIYEPFFTTTRGQGGSGLGMHIIFNLVNHSLNGHISCESEQGIGTTFKVTFPQFRREDHTPDDFVDENDTDTL